MRPLPVEPIPGAPSFVRGVSIVRGAPIPVVDLGAVLAQREESSFTRFVTVAIDGRRVAIAVEGVIGLRVVNGGTGDLPPLLRDASEGALASLGTLDASLLAFLRAGRLLSEELSRTILGPGDRS